MPRPKDENREQYRKDKKKTKEYQRQPRIDRVARIMHHKKNDRDEGY